MPKPHRKYRTTVFSHRSHRWRQFHELEARHQRRSEGAKRGWIKRRLRILEMLRSTWGTGLSDKNVPFSFTFYAYSEKDLDTLDMAKCEDKFISLINRWMRLQYTNRNYRYETAEADGWIQVIIRKEENVSIGYDKEVFKQWIFEINSSENERGELADIL